MDPIAQYPPETALILVAILPIGPLVKLPFPILAERWRRITFLYTTGEMLRRARTISDLVLPSEDRLTLWKSLRERAVNRQLKPSGLHLPEVLGDLDATTLAFLGMLEYLESGDESGLFPDL